MVDVKKVFLTLEKDHKPTMLEGLGNHTSFQMLVMTLLSSRTKDSTTIPIVKKLFKKYPNPKDFVKMDVEELEEWLYGIGFYKVKTKNVKKLSEILLKDFKGKVPDSMDELVSLPGVGRKTANCILAYTFGKPAIAVDVHVHRIANRLGWVKTKTPEETEEALKKLVLKKLWIKVNSLFVNHGQRVCLPINPKCPECKIKKYCEFSKEVLNKK
jgi:endonuclease-3